MEKTQENKIGEFLALVGFLMTLVTGLGSSFLPINTDLSMIFAFVGFMIFLIGIEIYLKTRKNA